MVCRRPRPARCRRMPPEPGTGRMSRGRHVVSWPAETTKPGWRLPALADQARGNGQPRVAARGRFAQWPEDYEQRATDRKYRVDHPVLEPVVQQCPHDEGRGDHGLDGEEVLAKFR